MGEYFPGEYFPRTENETPDLNSLKLSDFEPKTNIGDINSSRSDEEEGAEYKVKLISNSKVEKQSLTEALQNRFQVYNFIKKRFQDKCFPMKLTKFLRTPFLQNTSTLVATSSSKHCKQMKTYTENLCCRERKDISERYFQG